MPFGTEYRFGHGGSQRRRALSRELEVGDELFELTALRYADMAHSVDQDSRRSSRVANTLTERRGQTTTSPVKTASAAPVRPHLADPVTAAEPVKTAGATSA
ncbi:hypothetical protein GCM10027569_41200 [Flindersiella endophytica]